MLEGRTLTDDWVVDGDGGAFSLRKKDKIETAIIAIA